VKRLRRFNEAERRHVAHCQYCQTKIHRDAVKAFNESEKKQGSQMRADEDAVYAAPLPEKSRFSASEGTRMCSACETRTDDAEARFCSSCGGRLVDVEDDSEGYSSEEERDVRRGARAGESEKFLKEALAVSRKYTRESKRKN